METWRIWLVALLTIVVVATFYFGFKQIGDRKAENYSMIDRFNITKVEPQRIQVGLIYPPTRHLEDGYIVTLSNGSQWQVLKRNCQVCNEYIPRIGEKLKQENVYSIIYK
ncbi:MAG: hypothetical protein Q8N61_01865 [bacterium]|nr:hypothetical protein [bacterium]